jgi:hypothetical protein
MKTFPCAEATTEDRLDADELERDMRHRRQDSVTDIASANSLDP